MKDKEKQRELIVEIMKADEQSGLYDEPAMKQTAVDWMFAQLWDTPKDKLTWYKIAGDAKDMEKEQIIRARQDGLDNGFSNGNWDSNLYYNETYE
jgi:hypothetical protein